jgi:hypothetical protein
MKGEPILKKRERIQNPLLLIKFSKRDIKKSRKKLGQYLMRSFP